MKRSIAIAGNMGSGKSTLVEFLHRTYGVAPFYEPNDENPYLVDFYKRHNFDSEYIYRNCPYKVADIGIVAILHRATKDLIELCRIASHLDPVETLQAELDRTASAIDALWSDDRRCFLSRDLVSGNMLDEITTATILPLFGDLGSDEQSAAMMTLLSEWLAETSFGLSSTHPSSARYEPQRYWRGPVWPHMNWIIARSAADHGKPAIAEKLRQNTIRCVQSAGFWEYFDADTGAGCGGDNFSWTAAVALYWLAS